MPPVLLSRLLAGGAVIVVSLGGVMSGAQAANLVNSVKQRWPAPASRNLLDNPGAQAGAVSAQGWDTVTIPGWSIVRGLPTIVRYGTTGFPSATGRYPARRGGQLFAGGVGGTAVLRQVVRLRSASGGAVPRGAAYRLSAWLGASKSSRASVSLTFLGADGRRLGRTRIGPVGLVGTPTHRGLLRRAATGLVPPGATAARVDLWLASSLTNFDGEDGPVDGYNRALADDVRFSVSSAAQAPAPLQPPVARVPRYQHVFLFYFENQDFRAIIGDKPNAPYFNRLLPRSSLLANLYAEEHPSDGNYLALAGGSTFGIPLTDPLEEDPLDTIHAPNIGDLLDAAHESWKGYLQSANGPCDDTVHDQYWDDDLPMLYFADVRDRPAYCAKHLVPLEALRGDLKHTSTTPAFSWVSPDDCSDMEGCGVKAGDQFLAAELGAIMRSPAWRTQRSLAIITFDEDNYDHPRPAQRVATLMIGSTGVRRGYVSHVRYTHYSLLRTIEAALGLGTLTANDRFAGPVNDVFSASAGPVLALPSRQVASVRRQAPAVPRTLLFVKKGWRTAATDPMAFVADSGSANVTPIDLRTRKACADPGRCRSGRDRGRAGWADCLCRQRGIGDGHADQYQVVAGLADQGGC